jgi:hypothetical protein
MALEARTVSFEEEENTELADMRRRFQVSEVITVSLFPVAMADVLPGRPLETYASSWMHLRKGCRFCPWFFARRRPFQGSMVPIILFEVSRIFESIDLN